MFKYDELEDALLVLPGPEAYCAEVVWNVALGMVRNMIAGAADAEATTRDLVVLLLTEIEFLTTDLHYGSSDDTEMVNKLLAKDGAAEKPKPTPAKPPLTFSMRWLKEDLLMNGVAVANVYSSYSTYIGNVLLPGIIYDRGNIFNTENKARKAVEKIVIEWFERVTGESYE